MSNEPEGTRYYRPGPSSGHYPQYPQNPYPQGWTPGAVPAPPPPSGQDASPQQGQTPSGQPRYGQQPYGQQQYGQAQYGQAPPAGLGQGGGARVPRPGQVTTALILLIVATLPFVLMGVTAMFATVDDELLNQAGIPRAEVDAMMAQAGLTLDQLTQAIRVMGGMFLVLAAVYAALAVVAFLGRPGARIALVVLTAVYGLPLLLMMAPTLPLFAVAVLALAAAGLWLLFSPPARTWYASRAVRGGVPGRTA
ncbi:hypothetical protein ACLFMI_07215 [Pseudonocardia nantongensis]|uniref:hypothetical protein n=1 Tax=Pseudonocardia nantongensis TaxID=1181885 RepID=UPI003978C934